MELSTIQSLKIGMITDWHLNLQEQVGVTLDVPLAKETREKAIEEMQGLASELEPLMPEVEMSKTDQKSFTPPKVQFKKDGTPSKHALNFFGELELQGSKWYSKDFDVFLPCHAVLRTHRPFRMKDQPQLKQYLMDKGWEPTLWNYKKDANNKTVREKGKLVPTSPRLQDKGKLCPNLELLIESGKAPQEVTLAVRWLSLRNRVSTIKSLDETKSTGYLNQERVQKEGILSAGASGVTNTLRQKHRGVVNVPRVGSVLGEEFRSFFKAREGQVLVGYDASGLEARVEAHWTFPYKGGEAYAAELLDGDIHSSNAELFFGTGLPRDEEGKVIGKYRNPSKNGKYCVPMNTQALCKHKGWVHYNDLEVGDIILGYNTDTGLKEWTPVLDKVFFEDQDVYTLSNGWLKLRATSDHRWVVRQRTDHLKSRRLKISEYPTTFRTTEELNSESNIVMNAPMKRDLYGEDLLSTPKKYGTDWVSRVLGMDSNSRMGFLEGFMVADGCYDSKGGTWSWAQNRGEHSEAALTASFIETEGVVQVHGDDFIKAKLSKKSHRTCQRVSKEHTSTEDVWCVSTALGTWVMRQDDVITITGNCLSYGGQYRTLAATLGITPQEAKASFDNFWEGAEPLRLLKERLTKHWQDNGSKGIHCKLTGTYLHSRSEHSLINLLFQHTGAFIMDVAGMLMDRYLKEVGTFEYRQNGSHCYIVQGTEVRRLIYMHDEYLYECHENVAELIAELGVKSIVEAGKALKLNVPLDADAKIGDSWGVVH